MSSTYGFEIKSGGAGGDFLPIVRYDARAGRIFRDDRVVQAEGYKTEPVDITNKFKALCDFENMEVGWMKFAPGTPPSFAMAKRVDVVAKTASIPDRPSEDHRTGVRFVLKLAAEIGGDKPIREISSTAGTFLNGWKEVIDAYDAAKAANPGKLPVIQIDKDNPTVPVTTGQGQRQSTNYMPKLHLVGWAPRGDLVPNLRGVGQSNVGQVGKPEQTPQTNGAAPATGAQRAPAPQQQNLAAEFSSDFG